MPVTTQRMVGFGGKAVLKDGSSSIYAGADIEEWSASFTCETIDMTSKLERHKVYQLGQLSGEGSIKRMVVGPHDNPVKAGDVLTVELYDGKDPNDEDAAPLNVSGLVIITKVGRQSPAGKVSEDIAFQFTGAWTFATGS